MVTTVVGGMALVAACSAPPQAAPTLAPTAVPTAAVAAPAATVAPGATAPSQSIVTGAIGAVNGRTFTVTTNTGDRQVDVADGTTIEKEGKGTLSDLLPGKSVGITGKPDGNNVTAISIRIFPAALGTPRPGQFPMQGANAGNLMTNSVIDAFDGSKLTVSAAGQQYVIGVPTGTEVLKPIPAQLNELTPGVRILAVGPAGSADAPVEATSVSIFGLPPQ
jgi:hypothetical protein